MTARASVSVSGLPRHRAASLRAEARVAAALAAWSASVSSVRVTFADINGHRGGVDNRCAITVSLRGRRHLHAEDVATTPRLALAGALARLERRLLRTRELDRDSRRRPKKYYVADRVAGRRPPSPDSS